MKKYFITGAGGFVAHHFMQHLEELGMKVSVLGVDIVEQMPQFPPFKSVKFAYHQIDLLDKDGVDSILFDFQPDYILHLASYSSVAFSWKNPIASFQNNTNIFLNLIETVRKYELKTRILSVGSSEEYGNANNHRLPLKEEYAVDPLSPYAVARVSQEMLSKVYANSYGVDIVITRSFNHIGPGQKDLFVVPSFVKRIIEEQQKSNAKSIRLTTGNLEITRDFLDVRDVVKAYQLLLEKGKTAEIYNVCSGIGYKLSDIIDIIASNLNVSVTTELNPDFIRPNDNIAIIGCNEKLKSASHWQASYSMQDSIADIINYWQALL
ncbi:MAG: GDP-mannose 4,6-dehydratase [Bacteroidales bacterium]